MEPAPGPSSGGRRSPQSPGSHLLGGRRVTPGLAATKCHELGGLKQQNRATRSPGGQKREIEACVGHAPSNGSGGPAAASPGSWWLWGPRGRLAWLPVALRDRG